MTEDTQTEAAAQSQDSGTPQQAGGTTEQPKENFHQGSFDTGYGKAAEKFKSELEKTQSEMAELKKQLKQQSRAAAAGADAQKTAEQLQSELEEARSWIDSAEQREQSYTELFGKVMQSRMDKLPDSIRELAPGEGTSPAAMLDWLEKAEKAMPEQRPNPQGGPLDTNSGLKLDPKIYDPGQGGSVLKYREAVAQYGQLAVDDALARATP